MVMENMLAYAEIDIEKPLIEQNLKRETMVLLAILNLNYWCENEDENKSFLDEWDKNEEEKNILMSEIISYRLY